MNDELFSGNVFAEHTGTLTITATEDCEGPNETRYRSRMFENEADFLQCLSDIGIPTPDIQRDLKQQGYNRLYSLANFNKTAMTNWGLLEKLY